MGDHQLPSEDAPRPPEPAPREDVKLALNRCPYCHADVGNDDDFYSCRSCQARHHPECWQAHDACSTCGETRFLAETDAPKVSSKELPRGTAPQTDLGPAGLAVGLFAALLFTIGAFASYQSSTPTVDIPFGPSFKVGEPGFNAIGMLLTALTTVPLALVGGELSMLGWRRNPPGKGRYGVFLNALLALVATVAAFATW